jgi:DNA polymerase IV
MSSKRSIVHMDLDTFFVSCERLLDSRLNGQPILIGGTSDRGVVASCSYEARKFGVHAAMPMKMAKERCPEAIIIQGNSQTYTHYSKMVTEIIHEASPLYEKSSIDEFYMDFTGMDKFFGCLKYAGELRQKIIRETGLPISFGLSENKTVSKIATGEAKPNNQLRIDYGTEKQFLSPLSIRKIPMVGLKTYQEFCNLGIRKIANIQEMPLEMMESAFGKAGSVIWRKAQGIDKSKVEQYSERKSISAERTFEKDTIDIVKLRAVLYRMAEKTTFQLRKENKLTACITVKVRYSDFQTQTLQRKVPYSSADHELIPLIMELFEKLFNRRLLVRLVGIRYSELVHGNYQMNLFEDANKYSELYHAMDAIRKRFGDKSIMRAMSLVPQIKQKP